MPTLTVTGADIDYRDGSPTIDPGTDQIVFALAGTARFLSSQFGAGGVLDTVAITGDNNGNSIAVNVASGVSFSAAGWTFTNWSATADSISIFGTSGQETITGSISQENGITGGTGADALTGGNADDTFVYGSASDMVAGESVHGLGGTDLITVFGGSYDLSTVTVTGIEKLQQVGAVTVTLTGGQIGSGAIIEVAAISVAVQALIVNGASVNLSAVTFAGWIAGEDTITINGTAGNDSLTGSNQFDTFNGGLGDDTYGLGADNDAVNDTGGIDTITSTASRDLSAFAAIENLTLLGAAVNGTGNGLANTVTGNVANNILDGGGGGDTLRGLGGNDTYVVRQANDVVDEAAAGSGGADTVVAHVSFSLAQTLGVVEDLTLAGTPLNGTGNGLANTITGNADANTLDGAAGGDTMRGLAGNDTYVVDNIGDVVDESAGGSAGTDTVFSSVNLDLGGGTTKSVNLAQAASGLGAIEYITLTANAIEATGNGLANVITGNGAGNTLDGGDGADALLGGDGSDQLIGGLGPDQITGGNGIDTFAFLALSESGKKASTRDTILDFTVEDFIDLSVIDARKGGKDDGFKFIGKADFHGKKGELQFAKKNGDVIVSGDVNGDGKADFAILLDGTRKVTDSDFVL
ncbi:MAG TPA: calcium-binding protein [Bauldia sp.]|nr:calcium-binding protein [Bauldia sp.]